MSNKIGMHFVRQPLRMALCVLALSFWLPSIAVAGSNLCTARTDIVKQLDAEYGEKTAALGLGNGGVIVEVFTNRDGSTWTIIVTRPNGQSCVVAAGESWTDVEKPAPEPQI